MDRIEQAKKLIEKGFMVFPLQQNGKKPIIEAFTEQAASTAADVKKMWFDPIMEVTQPYNIGIATTRYRNGTDHEALLVVDVDTKDGRDGFRSLTELEINGKEFPPTLEQITPSGGVHLIYKVKKPVKQGTDVLGRGLDIRSNGGYIVAAGSEIDGKFYKFKTGSISDEIAEAPAWMIQACEAKKTAPRTKKKSRKLKLNSKAAIQRVTDYLRHAEAAISGEGGDERTFKVASRCKDLGVDQEHALDLLVEYWNPRCQPPWNIEDLTRKIENAFAYGQNEEGCDAPDSDFDEVEKPAEESQSVGSMVQEINQDHAFVVVGGRSTVLKEATAETLYMTVQAFHDLLKSKRAYVEGKWRQQSDLWMASPNRRTYARVELLPGKEAPPDVYNLWRGFSCEPLADGEEPTQAMIDGVAAFMEHAKVNVCLGDEKLYNWLMSYFAQMIQKPWQKPTTALVFRGEKGVGKNALIDRIGNLFRANYLLTSNKRYLTSNFNNHIARLLLFVLDEAFWSGDKASEGILKDLITGNKHLIEQKGKEMFAANNLTRVCVIGNEDWLVPASHDERRYSIFSVGTSRQQDTQFFRDMRKNIDDNGGNRLLLRELMNFDLEGFNVNRAPDTQGLLEQKLESLNPVHAWWHQCLHEGHISGIGFDGGEAWPCQIPVARSRLRDAFGEYAKERGIRSWLPSAVSFGKLLGKACPGLENKRIGARNQRQWASAIPDLKAARIQFERFIRQPIKWPDEEADQSLEEKRLFS